MTDPASPTAPPPDLPGSALPAALASVGGTLTGGGGFEILGEIAQTLTLELGRGQAVWTGRGSLMAHDPGISWRLRIPSEKVVGRLLSGEGLSMTYITASRPGQSVTLSANSTGKIAVWDLEDGPIVCTSGSFLAAVGDVVIDVTVARRAGAALFGGAGLLQQRVSGRGKVFIHGAGDFVLRDLQPGETLMVSTGNLAAYGAGVGYDIVGVGGCLKSLFGGEGLFMTRMTGPGRVLLQSMKRLPIQTNRR